MYIYETLYATSSIFNICIFDSICISCRFNINIFCLYKQHRLYPMYIYETLYATSSIFNVYLFDCFSFANTVTHVT